MYKIRIEDNDILTRDNKRIGSLAGNIIRDQNNLMVARTSVRGILDKNGHQIAKISSNAVFDMNDKKLASISGKSILNSDGRVIGTMRQIRREVEGGHGGVSQVAVWLLFVRQGVQDYRFWDAR